MRVFEDGDWHIYKYDSSAVYSGVCLRHTPCEGKEGMVTCACEGRCNACKVDVPDAMQGFFKLLKWER
ncbi:hypothetical protein LCGC14_3115040 [marine sediment metagenome]|uniref:Uncharacterized protein n=1 Tax=marine sediment metagenome TaxID=412755 RepID=A0A0F8WSZ9_9ZZZZ